MRLLPFEYSTRSLGRQPLRLVAGVGGAALVVALVLAAASFVRGMGESLKGTGDPRNVILLGAGSEESLERSEIPPAVAGIAAATIPGVKRRLGIVHASPEVAVALALDGAGGSHGAHGPSFATFRGVTPAAFLVHSRVRLLEGRFPGPGEVLVGALAAARTGVPPERLATGAILRVEGKEWTVAGRFAAPGTVLEAEIWMPLQDLLVATKRTTHSCVVLTMDGDDLSEADLFAKRRLDLELAAIPESVYYERLFAFYRPVRGMVWATALLVAAGAFFGGLNVLYASFAGRVREMATLQVLGFPRRAVAAGLVMESLLIAAAGSLAAAAAASWMLDGLAVRISMGAFGLRVDAPVLALGLAAGMGLGMLGALLPAWRCLRLPVAEGLRAI